jgi:hypothetical protein
MRWEGTRPNAQDWKGEPSGGSWSLLVILEGVGGRFLA